MQLQMAGKPRHFQTRVMSLLPPSYFVHKPTPKEDGAQEPIEVTRNTEVLRSKVDNDGLREQLEGLVVAGKKESDTLQQGQNLWHGQPAPCDTVPLAEFVKMKSQLQDCIEMLRTENSSISDRLINMEKLRLKEREVAQQRVEELNSQHEVARQSLLQEVSRCQEEKERFVQSKEAEVERALSQTGEEVRRLVEQLDCANAKVVEKESALRLVLKEKEASEKRWEVEVRQQEEGLKSKESKLQNLTAKMEELKRSHEQQLMDCLEQLTRFRSYTGCERPPEGDFPWWQEREELLAHNTCLSRDCSSLSKELQLVRVRLEALTEMLALQESGLCSSGTSGPPVEGEGEGAQQRLLTRWREKVFALLVQLKSQEINARAVGDAFQRERAALVEEHGRLCCERDLLRCSVEDKSAQLQLEQERNCGLVDSLKQQTAELAGSRQQAVGLEKVVCEACTGLRGIPSLVDHHRSVLQQVQTRLVGYEQRLGFAARRLQTVEVLCGRLRSRLTTTVSTQTGDVDTHEEGAGAGLAGPDDLQTLSRWELVSEVVQLSKERQALCDHISKLETSYNTAAAEKEEECVRERLVIEDKLCQCEGEVGVLRSRCSELEGTLAEMESDKAAVAEDNQQLRQEKLQVATTVQQRIQEALAEERKRTVEEFAAMEEQLNAARREQAKATVALQQSRREAVRERERLIQGMELEREALEGEVEGCKAKLASVMAERNLLVSNIRGEGLLQRALPTPLQAPWLPVERDHEGSSGVLEEASVSDSASSVSSCCNRTYSIERQSELEYRDQLGSPDAELQFSVPQPSGPVLSRRVKDADLVTALEDIQRLSSSLLKMEKNS